MSRTLTFATGPTNPVVFTRFQYMPELAVLFSPGRRVLSGWRIVGNADLVLLNFQIARHPDHWRTWALGRQHMM